MRYPGDVDAGLAPGGQERPPGHPELPWPRAGDGEDQAGSLADSQPGSGHGDRTGPDGRPLASTYSDAGYSDNGYSDALVPGTGQAADARGGTARWADPPAAGSLYGAAGGT